MPEIGELYALPPGAPARRLRTGRVDLREALGRDPDRPARFDGIEDLPRRVQVLPADADRVKALITQECE